MADFLPCYDYDMVDVDSGETVLRVRHLFPPEPADCCICEKPTYSNKCVPYYCGPTREGKSEGGYKTACNPCYARWEKWDDALTEYDSWIQLLQERTKSDQPAKEQTA